MIQELLDISRGREDAWQISICCDVLAYSTWHTIVMRLQCRLQLLKKAKGSCIQFFWQIHGWSCLLIFILHIIVAAMASGFLSEVAFSEIDGFLWNFHVWYNISSQIELLIKIIHVYDTYFYNYFIIAEIGDGPLAEIPESHTEVSSFLLLYWMFHHLCCMKFKKWI